MKTLKPVLISLCLCAAGPASAVVMDFESLNQAGVYNSAGTLYIEDGFQVAGAQLFSPGNNNFVSWVGSTTLFNNDSSSLTVLSKVGGGTFSLNSIDLSEFSRFDLGPTTVAFVGHVSGGGTLHQSLVLNGVFGLQTLAFSGWSNLLAVTWLNTSEFHQFDNINLEAAAVPVPATLGLLGLGLAGLGFGRRPRA